MPPDFCTPNQEKGHNFDIFQMGLLSYKTTKIIFI